MHEGLYQWLNHYYQMMLLEGAIVGIVVPVIIAQRPLLIAPWFLRRSLIWFGCSLVTGVLICAVSKWTVVIMMARLSSQFQRQDQAIAEEHYEETIQAGLNAVNIDFRPAAKRMVLTSYSGVIGDLAFYGGFLGGLYYLLQGLLQAA
jgi:hypothetical protein